MNKFTFALINETGRYFEEEMAFTDETVIGDLFDDVFGEPEWMQVLMQLQMLYAINVPDELAGDYSLTLGELSSELAGLPALPDNQYPEFLDACITIMEAWTIYKDQAAGSSDEQELKSFEREFETAVREPYKLIDTLFESHQG